MVKKPVEKNKKYIVDIIDNGAEGEGTAKIQDFIIFIPGAIVGEKIEIIIVKINSSYAYGKTQKIIKESPNRKKVECNTYGRCGGCNLRHINYEETLNIKKKIVQALVDKTLKNKIKVKETIGMENPINYRNKLIFPVGTNKNGKVFAGVYAKRTHEIIETEECFIQDTESQAIINTIIEIANKYNITPYNEETKKGLLRHIVIKKGFKTGEIMVVLILNGGNLPHENDIKNELVSKYKNIVSIVKNINTKNTNVIMGKESENLYGDGYIKDKLGEYIFRISAHSFYQVNPIQAEKLYNIAIESANIKKEDTVFDLYCGIGTISLFMAKYAKKVYGVEIVEQAITDAKENAKINNVENVEFLVGDTELVLEDLITNKKIIPDVVMVDPPRKGLDNKSIENILKILPKRFVYISCNSATLIRDLAKLEELYEVELIQPVDMFPFTSHVETVTALSLKENDEMQ